MVVLACCGLDLGVDQLFCGAAAEEVASLAFGGQDVGAVSDAELRCSWPRQTQDTSSPRLHWTRDTFEQRLNRLKRITRQIIAVGVALTAFVLTLAASDAAALIYQRIPFWVCSAIFTIIIPAGACLGSAYIRYDDTATSIEQDIALRHPSPEHVPGEMWPETADRPWRAALLLTVLAPLAFLAAALWAAIDR